MLTGHESFYPRFEAAVLDLCRRDVVLDLGTTYRFRKELAPFASQFQGRYWAMDYRARALYHELNVNVNGDLHDLPFASGCADGVICIEVLEHVREPLRAASEIYRVLKVGGAVLATTPFLASYHGRDGDYPDYYRFTHEGLALLFVPFAHVEVFPLGGLPYRLALTLLPVRLGRYAVAGGLATRVLNRLDRRWPTRNPVRWLVWAVK